MENLDEENLKLPTEEQKNYFKSLVKKPEYTKLITNSFAPEIKFRETEKLAVVISRIGSTKNGRIRGNIHSLLIGPPATAKSKILEFLPNVTQRCGYAVGGMATGAGITVTMATLEDKSKYPKGGIIVQCSGSCVVLDELNQFPQEDIGKTYSAMESGKIQYNKAGFDQIFTAETTIISGANPKNGRYTPELGMIKNINLPEPMISRFDIIVNVLPETRTQSRQISEHSKMIKETTVDRYIQDKRLLTAEEQLLLFNYASTFEPKMSTDAYKLIDDYVGVMLDLQEEGEQEKGTKQFDRRFAEAVTRIAEAISRLHLSETITKEYAMFAIEYMKTTLQTFGVKTEKGETTVTFEQLGKKDKSIAFEKCWAQMCKDADREYLPRSDFCQFLTDQYPNIWKTKNEADEYFENLSQAGELTYQRGNYRLVK
jgi:DNA replicative helicase MCM subunit Mcm2 (Cdc46/Mcm family)